MLTEHAAGSFSNAVVARHNFWRVCPSRTTRSRPDFTHHPPLKTALYDAVFATPDVGRQLTLRSPTANIFLGSLSERSDPCGHITSSFSASLFGEPGRRSLDYFSPSSRSRRPPSTERTVNRSLRASQKSWKILAIRRDTRTDALPSGCISSTAK